jgi:ferrous iron transport protein B
MSVAVLGVVLTFVISRVLSRSVLKGEVSTFSLELPPYRPPRVWQTIYTSIIDRTLIVLWRAIKYAAPAGALIWLAANITIGGESIAVHMVNLLNPIGVLIGLNGVILVAYIFAIPANEIVIPTVLMLTVLVTQQTGVGGGAGVLFDMDENGTLTLLKAGGWTLLTAINLMLFSLIHNPCSTTLDTIRKETGSRKWMIVSALLPLGLGFTVTFFVAQIWRLLGGA